MTGQYPSFNATQNGQSVLGPRDDRLPGPPPAPGPGGGYGGRFITGTGDRVMGPGTPNPSASPTSLTSIQQILRSLGMLQSGGGGGVGGAGGTAPGGIGPGQTGAESGQQFGAENAAVHPSIRSALGLASAVMNPITGMPMALANTAFPGIGQFLGNLGFPSASFNVPGPQLTPAQQQQITAAYQQYGPAFAQALLHSLRNMRANPTVTSMPGLAGPNFANPGFSISRLGSTPLTDAQINAEIGAYAPSWGGPGTAAGGGGGNLGGSGDAGSGGLGGGVGGGPAGGQNRSM